jgi:drug/metabolite transporter (DMT)-like permease
MPFTPTQRDSLVGILWMIGWAACINGAMICAKHLTPGISSAMLIFMRSVFGLMTVLPLILHQGRSVWHTKQPTRQILSCFISVLTMGCTYYAYRNLPLSFATTIGFTGPLMTTLFAIFFLKEKVTLGHWLLIALGYVGVIVIFHPKDVDLNMAAGILLLANVMASLLIINRKIILRTDSPLTNLAYSTVGSVVISGIISIFFWQNIGMQDLMVLVGVGIFGVSSHYCYLHALEIGDPSYVSPFEYSRLLIAAPVGILLFGETLAWTTVAGAGLIVLAGLLLMRLQMRKGA